MIAKHESIDAGFFWYPFRPWLRWPIRVLGILGILVIVVKITFFQRWSAMMGIIGPPWLLLTSFATPVPKLKTGSYYLGAALVWLAAIFTLLVIVLWSVAP